MTSGFKNSAGTDLDSLFYSDNGNAGALGFKNSSGTDLGNKYTSSATLGYSVGYKNSAGTDLGYLRGNTDPTTPSGLTATVSGSLSYQNYYQAVADGETDLWVKIQNFYGLVTINPTLSNYSSAASYSCVITFTHAILYGIESSSSLSVGKIFYPPSYSGYSISAESGETAYTLGNTITLGYTGSNTYEFRLADPSYIFGINHASYSLKYSLYIKNNTSGQSSATVTGSWSVSRSWTN